MNYVLLTIGLVLLLLNIRASASVTRSSYDSRSQKMAQLALVWLIPFIGALITTQIHKEANHEFSPSQPWRDGGFEYGADRALSQDVSTHNHASPSSEC